MFEEEVKSYRIELDIKVTGDMKDYDEVQAKDRIERIKLLISQAIDNVLSAKLYDYWEDDTDINVSVSDSEVEDYDY